MNKLSPALQLKAVKDQINVCVKGLNWKEHHTNWSSGGVAYAAQCLVDHLKKIIRKFWNFTENKIDFGRK